MRHRLWWSILFYYEIHKFSLVYKRNQARSRYDTET
jgi:hypothetical protein